MNHSNQTLQLKEGRTLAYAEYGLPHGTPVFFFHGTPGSRFYHPPDEITKRLGVRLITADRPGYGESTFQPRRRLLDWPADVTQLADALGLEKFAVTGHSGGGPHTLACAYALPDRVTASATLSGAGPVDAPGATDGMIAINKLGFRYGRSLPWPLWRLLVWTIYHRRRDDPAGEMDRENGIRAKADDELLLKPEIRQNCLNSEIEAFRHGLRGMTSDARLITSPWGFRLEDIRVPVHFWHGTTDDVTTAAMARYMASRVPNARLSICEGEAHLLLFPHWEEILTKLLSE